MKRLRPLALSFILAACSSRTELLLGVATDLNAPDALDRVHLEVQTANDTLILDWDISGNSYEPFKLPGSYGLLSESGSMRVDIALTGYKADEALLTRRAVMNLVEDKTLFFRMGLTAGCVGRDDCPPDWSCVEGVCRDVNIDSEQLPDWDPALVTELTCAARVSYIDTATRTAMPLTADAPQCPNSRCYEGTCLHPPEAESGTRTITGSRIVTYVQPNGVRKHVPVDLTNFQVSALVTNGTGGVTTIEGVGAVDGTFTIPNVPRRPYYVKFGGSYFYTDADALDLGYVELGRDDAMPPTQTTGTLNVSLTNMTPWVSTDVLEAFAPDANAWWFFLSSESGITAGTTALSNYVASRNFSAFGNLVQNDPWAIIQLSTKMLSGGEKYQAATRMFTPPPFIELDGGQTNITGTFSVLPQDQMMTFEVRTMEWESAAGFNGTFPTLMAASGEPRSDGVFMSVAYDPGAGVYGFFSPTIDAMFASVPHGANKMLSNVAFGVPTIGAYEWRRVVHSEMFFQVPYTATGATNPRYLAVGLSDTRLVPGPTLTVTPSLGPVRNPIVAGLSLLGPGPLSGVGLTPQLSWDPPALGTATQYSVSVVRLTANGSNTSQSTIATFYSPDTSVTIPPGVLVSGGEYVFYVTAGTMGSINAPFRRRFPDAYAGLLSVVITP